MRVTTVQKTKKVKSRVSEYKQSKMNNWQYYTINALNNTHKSKLKWETVLQY